MNYGVLLSRCQPLHSGHIDVIKRALSENDKVLLVIGSANKSGTERNPFDISLRLRMYLSVIEMLKMDIDVLELNDLSSDSGIPYESAVGNSDIASGDVNPAWGSYFYENIVRTIGCDEFAFYYNDNQDIVSKWFSEDMLRKIHIVSSGRSEFSSSHVRQALLDNDMDYLRSALPYFNDNEIKELSDIYEKR